MPSARLCIAAVVVAASIAACGSSSTPASTSTTTPATSSTQSATASGPATVKVIKVSGYPNALGTASGQPLYMLSSDKTNASSCGTSCVSTWPALLVTAKPVAGSGVTQSLLSEFKRTDGKEQVSYNGHALYTFTGSTVEDAIDEDGGTWYLISAKGVPIKHTTASGSY